MICEYFRITGTENSLLDFSDFMETMSGWKEVNPSLKETSQDDVLVSM